MLLLKILIVIFFCLLIARMMKSIKMLWILLFTVFFGFAIGLSVKGFFGDNAKESKTILQNQCNTTAMLDLGLPFVKERLNVPSVPTGKPMYNIAFVRNEKTDIAKSYQLLTGSDPPRIKCVINSS